MVNLESLSIKVTAVWCEDFDSMKLKPSSMNEHMGKNHDTFHHTLECDFFIANISENSQNDSYVIEIL